MSWRSTGVLLLLLLLLVPVSSLHDESGHLAPGIEATSLLCPSLSWPHSWLSVCTIEILGPVIDEHSHLKID